MQPKLTDSQLVILSAASMRDAGHVLPLPSSLTLNKGSAALVLKSLLARDLITEVRASPGDELWREAEDGRWTLRLTYRALTALGLDEDHEEFCERGSDALPDNDQGETPTPAFETRDSASPARSEPASGTKLAIMIALLRREQGATLDELMMACGWQAHSVRGAISGAIRKKLSLSVSALTIEGRGKVYRIEPIVGGLQAEEVL